MWAVPKIVFDFFWKRRRKQEEALTNQAGKQDQKQGSCLVLEGEILLLPLSRGLCLLARTRVSASLRSFRRILPRAAYCNGCCQEMRQNLYAELCVLSCLFTGTSRIVFASISITNSSQTSNEMNVWAKINSPAKNKTEIRKNWRSICLSKSVPHLSHFRGVQRLISHTLNGDIRLSHFGHRIKTISFID